MKEALAATQLFSQLDDGALNEISSAAHLKKAGANELLFSEGEPAHSFFIVKTGKVKVFKLSPDGKEQILMIARPGDTFAEAALFSGGAFPASAQALEQSELVAIDRARFIRLIGHSPELAVNLIARLSELLHKMTRLIEAVSLSDVNTRLARYLCAFADPETGEMPSKINLSETKTVLAAMLGTIPETFSRALAKLSRDKLIEVEGRTITILNPEGLARQAAIDS